MTFGQPITAAPVVGSAAVAVDQPVSPEDPQTVRSGRLIATMIPLKIDAATCDLHPQGRNAPHCWRFQRCFNLSWDAACSVGSSILTTSFDVSVAMRLSIT